MFLLHVKYERSKIFMRNPNGYGSVYKLSGKRRKPYAARITMDWNEKGQPIYKFIGYFDNRKDAVLCLANYNTNPYDVSLQASTVADMWEMFKKRKFKDDDKSSRYRVYHAAYKNISPLHNIEIRKLKTYHIQEVIDNLNRGTQSKSHIQMLVNQLFNLAIELDICNKNYSKFVEAQPKKKSTIHKAFDKDEVKILWDNVFVNETAVYALILIYTGMRPSELVNLETKNIFLNDKYLVGGSKTEAGRNRIIPINDKIYPLICKLYDASNSKLIKSESYGIFKKQWDIDMKKMGLKHLPHDGRHTFASLMNTAEANKTSIKRIMGHVSNDITEDVYTHKTLPELLYAVNLI